MSGGGKNLKFQHEALDLIEKLGLKDFFPGKLTIQHARSNAKSEVKDYKDIPWYLVGKLLSTLDQKGWYEFESKLDIVKKVEGASTSSKTADTQEKGKKSKGFLSRIADDDDDEEEDSTAKRASKNFQSCIAGNDDEGEKENEKYDIRDIVVAVFLCSDNILKKILSQKLYFSRLSIPFVLPNVEENDKLVLQWWCFRGMRIDYDFANTPGHVVSVIRLTKLPISRAEVLNRMLFDKSHDTFYKVRGNAWEEWTNGLIEVGTYRPSECCKKEDTDCDCPFRQQILFFNLSGNCKHLPKHQELACKLSSVVTVFLDIALINAEVIDDIVRIVESAPKTILVLSKDENFPYKDTTEKLDDMCTRLDELSDENLVVKCLFEQKGERLGVPYQTDKIERVMRKAIKDVLDKCEGALSLKRKYDEMKLDFVTCDDDEKLCKIGMETAERIRDELNRESNIGLIKIKEIVMPLQCNQWAKWSEIERSIRSEQGKSDQESQDEFIERMEHEQKKLRREQIDCYRNGMSKIMNMFCTTIKDEKHGTYPRNYFLHWLKIFLNEISSKEVQTIRRQLDVLLKSGGTREKIKRLRAEIRNVSFDVKHFFREIGQVVEAMESCSGLDEKDQVKLNADAEDYSRIVASLFIQGVPIEILDSSATQVPITFLRKVFHHVKLQLKKAKKDGKVFVLSVLGVQSSGKSTFLNALFGTQFETSIGLCTEGINAQLIPIPDDLKSNGYEYILLLDTKGLYGTDRDVTDPHSGDNELATLIFGLSDLTILNVMGAARAAVEDTLQVVACAMLKIKQVNKGLNIDPKCLFVHQNVDDGAAKDVLRSENESFQEQLDDIVRHVAGKMAVNDVSCFSDLIQFDNSTDVIYIPNLWKGSPPMATINRGYSKKVAEVSNIIFNKIMSGITGFQADMNTFSTRLEDLWTAILGTDFIFSFKNHLEINAFDSLDAKFNNLRSNLNEAVTTIFNEVKDGGEKTAERKENIVKGMMDSVYEKQNTDLIDFFEKTSEGTLLKDLKERYINSLQYLTEEKVKTVMRRLKRNSDMDKRKETIEPRLNTWKEEARKKAIEGAQRELDRGVNTAQKSENAIDAEFDRLWNALKESVPRPEPDANLPEIVRSVMKNVANLVPDQLKRIDLQSKNESGFRIDQDHFYIPPEAKITRIVETNIRDQINQCVTSRIVREVDVYLREINDEIFDDTHAEQTIQIALSQIRKWNDENQNIQLTDAYKISMLTFIGKEALPVYEAMQEAYNKRMDAKIDEFKKEIRSIYRASVYKIAREQAAAKLLCERIEVGIKEKVNDHLKAILPQNIRKFNHCLVSKQTFNYQVMEDLLRVDSFQEYMSFLGNPEDHSTGRLKQYIHEYLFKKRKIFAELAVEQADKITNDVKSVINRKYASGGKVSSIQPMVEELSHRLPSMKAAVIVREVTSAFANDKLDVILFFKYLVNEAKEITNHLKKEYNEMTRMGHGVEKHVEKQLLDHVQGCLKRCPFCSVTCSNASKDHTQDCFSSGHYPICLNGFKAITAENKLNLESCNRLVTRTDKFRLTDVRMKLPMPRKIMNFFLYGNVDHGADECIFKEYKKVYTEWNIDAKIPEDDMLLWKRFLWKFSKDLAQRHKCKPAEIPKRWNYQKTEVLQSLRRNHLRRR